MAEGEEEDDDLSLWYDCIGRKGVVAECGFNSMVGKYL
jgi:hypothetical protein